jgi:outer membrane lipoprotein-sorting protein
MKMKYAIIIIGLLFTGLSFGQDAKAKGILDKLSTKMKAQKTFYVEFSASIKNTKNGTNESLTGKGWVKGDKFCASYGENTIISNGVKTWTVVKEEKTVYEADADEKDEESMNPKKLMTMWETGFKNKYDKESTLNSEKVHVINLYPSQPKGAKFHTIILYISKATNELKKVIMKGNDGTEATYSLTKFTSNPTVEDAKFVYDKTKYPGYKLVKN